MLIENGFDLKKLIGKTIRSEGVSVVDIDGGRAIKAKLDASESLSGEDEEIFIHAYEEIGEGFYYTGLNFKNAIKGIYDLDYSFMNDLGKYGVCDSIEQLQQYLQTEDGMRKHVWTIDGDGKNSLDEVKVDYINDPDMQFAVFLVEFRKEDQPEQDGWRWHKWGEYIGVQNPQHEYLYDEENIEKIYTYSIMRIK